MNGAKEDEMRAEYQFTVPAPADLVWMLLTERDSVLGCVPQLTVSESGPRSVEGTLRLRVRPSSATFHGSGQLTGRDADARGLSVQLEGTQLRGSGTLKADLEISVASANGSGSVVTVSTEFEVTGPLTDSGGSAIEAAVGRLLARFGANVLNALSAETGLSTADAAQPAVPGSVSPASGVAPVPPETPAAGPDLSLADAPARVAPASAASEPPVFELAALPSPARRQILSPAVLGRFLAVAAATIGAVAAARRLRRR